MEKEILKNFYANSAAQGVDEKNREMATECQRFGVDGTRIGIEINISINLEI